MSPTVPEGFAYGYDPAGDADVPCTPLQISGTPPARHVIPASMLPPVGQQGTAQHMGIPPSCTAWASTYGLATAAAARAGSYEPNTPDLQASPAFIYIQVIDVTSGEPCKGSAFMPYFTRLAATGTPTLADAPYDPDCTTLVLNYHDPQNPPPMSTAFQLGPVQCIPTKDHAGIKQTLAANLPVAYATHLYTDWPSYQGTPTPYVGNGKLSKDTHCMMIIGYDDDLGAWLIQNSAGTGWGDKGYVWMAYHTFHALASEKAFFYP